MPGWHEKTKELVKSGELKVVGITEEQHADRSHLFMQWKQMNWPILVDSFNLLELKAVPYTLLIDSHGIIRFRNPKEKDLKKFLSADYSDDATDAPEIDEAVQRLTSVSEKSDADAFSTAITDLENRIEKSNTKDGWSLFRRGVIYRMRYDSDHRKPGDFANAIKSWSKALEQDPGQYIWRRRIQQYGPILDKPYPFYDWVTTAKAEIVKRGGQPVSLVADLSGAEVASPRKRGKSPAKIGEQPRSSHPDPDNKITSDEEGLLEVEVVTVPHTTKKGSGTAMRVHLQVSPAKLKDAHWNNENEPPVFWLDSTEGLIPTSPAYFDQDNEKVEAVSTEQRTLEFEVHPEGDKMPQSVSGRLFAYVCEGKTGVCRFVSKRIYIPLSASGGK